MVPICISNFSLQSKYLWVGSNSFCGISKTSPWSQIGSWTEIIGVKFIRTAALCYKFSSSYQHKKLYFFSNHSINTWLHCIPWSFHCKMGDSLLIRPKGDWSCAFTYSTGAMNNTTLLYGLQWLTLHNHVPIIQVFIWAVNSQPWLSHIISGAKNKSVHLPTVWIRKNSPLDRLITFHYSQYYGAWIPVKKKDRSFENEGFLSWILAPC